MVKGIKVNKSFKYLMLILCVLTACAQSTANMSKYDSFTLQSGVVEGHPINENLNFRRVSLYQELNMLLDIISIRLDEIGEFQGWFSEEEKKQVQACANPLLFLVYTLDETRLRQSLVTTQMQSFGFKIFGLLHFRENLGMHPGFVENSLKMYKAYAFCGPKSVPNPLIMQFPGFEPIEIRLK